MSTRQRDTAQWNWPAYNTPIKRRGSLMVWLNPEVRTTGCAQWAPRLACGLQRCYDPASSNPDVHV